MADWKISTRTPGCSTCGRTFDEDERHVSSLSFQGEELLRSDACVACFRPQAAEEELCFWYSRVRQDRKRGLDFDLPTLEHLFLRLEGRTEPRVRELRYVLCLILMRKRRLKLVRVERGEGGESMLVRRPRREEHWQVYVFDFAPERLELLRSELLNVFEGADPTMNVEDGGPSAEAEALSSEASDAS